MVPTQPTACFVAVKANLGLVFFEKVSSGQRMPGRPYQVCARNVPRRVAEVELDCRRGVQFSTEDPPDLWARQAAGGFADAQKSKVTHLRSFAAFFDRGGAFSSFSGCA